MYAYMVVVLTVIVVAVTREPGYIIPGAIMLVFVMSAKAGAYSGATQNPHQERKEPTNDLENDFSGFPRIGSSSFGYDNDYD